VVEAAVVVLEIQVVQVGVEVIQALLAVPELQDKDLMAALAALNQILTQAQVVEGVQVKLEKMLTHQHLMMVVMVVLELQ
jgi:hypothetical protein